MEGLFEGLTEMTAHYSPEVEESTIHTAPRQHKEVLLEKEKEPRRDKDDTGFPGVSVAPLVDSPPVTHSVIRNDNEQISVDENKRSQAVQSSHKLPYTDTKYEMVSSVMHTSTSSHMTNQPESVGEELPSLKDLPAAPEQQHTGNEHHCAEVPTPIMPTEATSHTKSHPTDLSSELTSVLLRSRKGSTEKCGAGITEKSLDTDMSGEEELSIHAMDSTECGDDSPGTTGISSVPQVGSLGSAAVCLLTLWGCACLVALTNREKFFFLGWLVHY